MEDKELGQIMVERLLYWINPEYNWSKVSELEKHHEKEELLKIDALEFSDIQKLYDIDSKLDFEHQYLKQAILTLGFGIESENRTNIDVVRKQYVHIDLHCHYSFPIMRGKQIGFKTAFVEFMWIMLGRTDLKFLKDNGVNYWDSWVNKETGEFGKIYGHQMRYFDNEKKFDQLLYVINEMRTNPNSRRALINLWNGSDLNEQSLACCHFLYHFTSFEHNGTRWLDLHVNQRSADCFLGVPYDFLLFSFMLHFMSIMTGYKPRIIHCTFNDWHVYKNHFQAVKQHNDQYLSVVGIKNVGEYRNLKDIKNPQELPQIEYNQPLISSFDFLNEDNLKREITKKELDNFLNAICLENFDLFRLKNYSSKEHYSQIKAEVAV